MKKNIHVIDHPLLQHKLGYLRDKDTKSSEFRDLVKEISGILAYEAMRDWKSTKMVEVNTPIAKAKVLRIDNSPVVVTILRAGLGMLEAVLSVVPFAPTAFIGIYRDKFVHNTVEYYFKMPVNIAGKTAILCDPLIASADTMMAAIERLKSYEVNEIKVLCVLISKAAIARIHKEHPEVEIFTLSIEKTVNELGYLVPGLGDAGDRLYQTK